MNKLSCQSCGSALQADGFDRRLAVVHCSHCGVLYDLTKPRHAAETHTGPVVQSAVNLQTANNANVEPKGVEDSRPVAAMPAGFNIAKANGKLTVRWSWRSASAFIQVGFAVIWTLTVFRMGGSGLDLFKVMFMLVGVSIVYSGIAGIINSTTITADESQLRVRHAPLPWYPAPTIATSTIEQLFVSEGFTKSKSGRKTPYYILNAVLRDNSLKRLSSKLPAIETAIYLEQEFERALYIRDRRVAGEVRTTSQHL